MTSTNKIRTTPIKFQKAIKNTKRALVLLRSDPSVEECRDGEGGVDGERSTLVEEGEGDVIGGLCPGKWEGKKHLNVNLKIQ